MKPVLKEALMIKYLVAGLTVSHLNGKQYYLEQALKVLLDGEDDEIHEFVTTYTKGTDYTGSTTS